MKRLALLIPFLGLFLFGSITNATGPNDPEYWESQTDHSSRCYKHFGDSNHGANNGTAITLSPYNPDWYGDHWELLVIKGGNDRNVIFHPSADTPYFASDSQPRITDWIVCKGDRSSVVTTTAPPTTAPVTTAPPTTVPVTTVPATTQPPSTVPATTVPATTIPFVPPVTVEPPPDTTQVTTTTDSPTTTTVEPPPSIVTTTSTVDTPLGECDEGGPCLPKTGGSIGWQLALATILVGLGMIARRAQTTQ